MDKQEKKETLAAFLQDSKLSGKLNKMQYQRAQYLYDSGLCRLLSLSEKQHSYLVSDHHEDVKTTLRFEDHKLKYECSCGAAPLCSHLYASALQAYQDLSSMAPIAAPKYLKYSKDGMVKRVLKERAERAKTESFKLHFADNKHGEHLIENAKGVRYQLSFYNFQNHLGYCSCPDYQTNKLSTCKHLMYAFNAFEIKFPEHHSNSQHYPFVEIYCNPKQDYRICWFYPHKLPDPIASVLQHYFDKEAVFKEEMLSRLHIFLDEISEYKVVKLRPEVHQYAAVYYREQQIQQITNKIETELPQVLNHSLLPFQELGIAWAIGKRACILADEIGLGKSVQALGAAIHKLRVYDLNSLCILCPEALVPHWETEIEKWVPEVYHASIQLYALEEADKLPQQVDILIVDEAQKINDYSLSVLSQIRAIDYQQMLLITDSKLENSLIKFYTMVGLFDKHLMNPLWEISYQHCLFDNHDPDKIISYYHTEKLLERLKNVYLRRERKELIDQLPKANLLMMPVALKNSTAERYVKTAKKACHLLRAKYKSAYDISQLKLAFNTLIALSKYNFVKETKLGENAKIQEFIHFVQHKLHIDTEDRVVVFADRLNLQQQLLRSLNQIQLSATLSADAFESENSTFKFLICKEHLQNIPPQVQHYVYFHLPENIADIQVRQKKIVIDSESLQQVRIYLLHSRHSMEEVLYQWSSTKPHYLQQFVNFITKQGYTHNLDASLENLLIKILESEIQKLQKLPQQMSLFDKDQNAPLSNPRNHSHQSAFMAFNVKLMQAFKQFEALDEKSKAKLLAADYEIKETDDAWHIVLKKQ